MASTTTGTEKVPSAIPSTSSSASALGSARETVVKERARNPMMVATEFNEAVRTSLRDQPMTTLAAAVGIGFVLGAIWKT